MNPILGIAVPPLPALPPAKPAGILSSTDIVKVAHPSLSEYYTRVVRPGFQCAEFYAIPHLNIFGTTWSECFEMWSLHESLQHRGEMGLLIYKKSMAELKGGRKLLLGVPGRTINWYQGKPAGGMFSINPGWMEAPAKVPFAPLQKWVELNGKLVDKLIALPLDVPPKLRELRYCHEEGHFGVTIFTGTTANPTEGLPPNSINNFQGKWAEEASKFAKTPTGGSGSLEFHRHLFLRKRIFEKPLSQAINYSQPYMVNHDVLAAEIGGEALGLELYHRGGYLQKHCPVLRDALHEALLQERSLPSGVRQDYRYFTSPQTLIPTPIVPISVNSVQLPQHPKIEALKTVAQTCMQKTRQFAREAGHFAQDFGWATVRGIPEVLNSPIPNIAFELWGKDAFSPGNEEILLEGIRKGTLTWGIGRGLSAALGQYAIILAPATFAAELVPQGHFLEIAKKLPSNEEIDQVFQGSRFRGSDSWEAIAYKMEVDEMKQYYFDLHGQQQALKWLNPIRILEKLEEGWEKLKVNLKVPHEKLPTPTDLEINLEKYVGGQALKEIKQELARSSKAVGLEKPMVTLENEKSLGQSVPEKTVGSERQEIPPTLPPSKPKQDVEALLKQVNATIEKLQQPLEKLNVEEAKSKLDQVLVGTGKVEKENGPMEDKGEKAGKGPQDAGWGRKFASVAIDIANRVLDHLKLIESQNRLQAHRRQVLKQFDEQQAALEHCLNRPPQELLPELQHFIYEHCSPRGLALSRQRVMAESQSLFQELKELNECEKLLVAREQALPHQIHDAQELVKKRRRHLEKAQEHHSSLIKGLQYVGMALSVAAAIVCPIAGAAAAAGVMSSATTAAAAIGGASAVGNIAQHFLSRSQGNRVERNQRKLHRTQQQEARLIEELQETRQQKTQLEQEFLQLFKDYEQNPYSDQQPKWKKLIEIAQKQHDGNVQALQKVEGEINRLEQALKAIPEKFRGSTVGIEQRLEGLNKQKKTLKEQEKRSKDSLEKLQALLSKEKELAPFRSKTLEYLPSDTRSPVEILEDNTTDLRFVAWESNEQRYRQNKQEVLASTQQAGHALSSYLKSPFAAQIFALGAYLTQIWDEARTLGCLSLPTLLEKIELKQGVLAGIKSVGTDNLIRYYYAPMMRLAASSLSYIELYHFLTGQKGIQLPPVFEDYKILQGAVQKLQSDLARKLEGLEASSQEILSQIKGLKADLGILHDRLENVMLESKEEILQSLRDQNANQHYSLVNTFGGEIEGKEIKDLLKLPERIASDTYTGYHSLLDGFKPVVGPALWHENPHYFTGLLGKLCKFTQPLANGHLLSKLTQTVLQQCQKLSPEQLHQFKNLLENLDLQQTRLLELISAPGKLLIKLQHASDGVQEEMQARHAKWQALRLQKLHGASAPSFAWSSELVGWNKFFLYRELRLRPLQTILDWNFTYQNSSAMKSQTAYGSAAAFAGKITWEVLKAEKVKNAIASSINLTDTKAALLTAAVGALTWAAASYLRSSSQCTNLAKIETISKHSLQELYYANLPSINWGRLTQPVGRQTIYLESSRRKLFASEKAHPIHIPWMHAELGQDSNIGLQSAFESSLPFQVSELGDIPHPQALDQEAYNKAAQKLRQEYIALIEGKPKEGFITIFKEGHVLSGVREGLPPLAFPKTALKISFNLNEEAKLLEAYDLGTLHVRYDFIKEAEEYHLALEYRFSADNNPFSRDLLATFDAATVEAFNSQLGHKMEDFKEFLIQAFYGNLVGLGLPGAGTHRLNCGLIAPREYPFMGMWELLKKFPGARLDFCSADYDVEVVEALGKGVPVPAFISKRPAPELQSGYLATMQRLRENKAFEKERNEYEKNYGTLLAVSRLLSKATKAEIQKSLAMHVGIFPPQEMLTRIVQNFLPRQGFRNMGAFAATIAEPSEFVKEMRKIQAETRSLLNQINHNKDVK